MRHGSPAGAPRANARDPRRRRRARRAAGALLLALSARSVGAATVAPDQASRHLGQVVDVVGTAESVVCSPMACLLSFEAGFAGLVVAIPGDAVAAFPEPEATYEGRQVRVHGRVGERNGRPRIEIRDPAAISIVGGGESRRAGAGGDAGGRRIVSTRSSVAAPTAETSSSSAAPAAARPGAAGAAASGLPAGLPGEGSADAPAPEARPLDAPTADPRAEADAGEIQASEPTRSGPPPSRSRLVPSGAAGGGSFAAAGGRVRVDVAPPKAPSLSAGDAAARLGFPVEGDPGDGAPLGGAGELALLRQEIAALSDRIAEIEGAIGELSERVTGLEGLAAPAMAERQARAESVGPAPAPRSGSPALHRVKRGYSAKQVLRVLGEPLQVEGNPNGQFTWYYDGGRVVTIDSGGVVMSAVGF